MRFLCFAFIAFVFVSGLSACGLVYLGDDSDADQLSAANIQFGSLCGSAPACAITDELCQNLVLRITACIRGDEMPELPSLRIITRDQLRDELSAKPEDTSRESIALRNALAAMQLLAADTSLHDAQAQHEVHSVAAFYRLEQRDVTVVSDGIEDQREAMTTLSHEFTHYLQDQAGQLELVRGKQPNTDQYVAREALTEGDATLTSLRASVAMRGGQLANDRWPELFTALDDEVAKETNGAESPLVAALNLMPYSISLRALSAAWQRGSHKDVDTFFDEPPSSAVDWLRDETGNHADARPELECYPPRAPEGYERLASDSLGLLGLYALLGVEGHASMAEVSAWQNDVLAVYAAKGDNTSASLPVHVVWRIDFSDAPSAERFANAIASGLRVTRNGASLTLSVSSDPTHALFSEAQLGQCGARE